MIGCLRTRVRKQPIIALYFESENELRFYNLEAWYDIARRQFCMLNVQSAIFENVTLAHHLVC